MPTLSYLVWLLWIVNQHTFGCQEISGTQDIRYIKIQYSFEPLLWSWPWKQSIFFHKAVQLMTMYHPIKFGCKEISSSADVVKTVIFDQMSPVCDHELEDSKPVFLHDTLAHDVASPYQFWLQKVQQLRRYHPDEHWLKFWTFSVTSTLTTTEQSNLFWRQSTLWIWLCAVKPSLTTKGSAVQKIY